MWSSLFACVVALAVLGLALRHVHDFLAVNAPVDGENETTYAALARQALIEQGLEAAHVIALPAPDSAQDRTYLSAVRVRLWAAEQARPPCKLDALSAGVHSRRTQLMYPHAFGHLAKIGLRAARPLAYPAETWWQTSAGAKAVVGASISWLWSSLFFRPPDPGSEAEMWGDSPNWPRAHRAPPSRPRAP